MNELDDRLAERVRETYRRTPPLGTAATRRLAAALGAERPHRESIGRRLLGRGREIRLPLLAAASLAAALVAIGVWIGWGARSGRVEPPVSAARAPLPAGSAAAEQTVEFVLVAPAASRVALVGDFNDWNLEATPMLRTPSGDSWTVAIPLPPGRHVYAFVVDGARWLADPVAPLAPEDGFGSRNSVVVVGGAT